MDSKTSTKINTEEDASISINDQETGNTQHQKIKKSNQMQPKSLKKNANICETERLIINEEIERLIKNAEEEYLAKKKQHESNNEQTSSVEPQTLDELSQEEMFLTPCETSCYGNPDNSLPNKETLQYNKIYELRPGPKTYTHATISQQGLLRLENAVQSYRRMQYGSNTTISNSDDYSISYDDDDDDVDDKHKISEVFSVHHNVTKESESQDTTMSKQNPVSSKTNTVEYESSNSAVSQQDAINTQTFTIEPESSDITVSQQNTVNSETYTIQYGSDSTTVCQHSTVNRRKTYSITSQDYNASSEISSCNRLNVRAASFEKKASEHRKLHGSTYTIKSQICNTYNEQSEISENENQPSTPSEMSKTELVLTEKTESDITSTNMGLDSLEENYEFSSESCNNLTPAGTETEFSCQTEREQILYSTETNKSAEGSSFTKDYSSIYSKKMTQKCWKTWRAYVQCVCTHKAQTEERKNRQAKIQEFVDLLRHHKEISDSSDKISRTGNQEDSYSNLETCKPKQPFKIRATRKLNETSKTDESKVVIIAPIKNRKSQNALGSSLISNTDHEYSSKCSVLKQTTSLCHRYEAQQQIIVEQKKQLEAQKRVIDSLKLENLNKDAKLSATQAAGHLKHKVSKRATSLCDETKKVRFLSTLPSTMQQRENWRHMMRERKERVHRERMLKKEAELQNQKQAEDDERRRIEYEIKEKRWLRLQAEKKKQLAKHRTEEIIQKAREHYKKTLLKRYGVDVFKTVVAHEKEKMILMREYYNKRNLMKHFYEWQHYVADLIQEKKLLATSWYNNKLLSKGFSAFLKIYEDRIHKEQVAEDYSSMRCVKQGFEKLQLHTYRQQILNKSLQEQAEEFYKRKLLERVWKAWKLLPSLSEEERKKEDRKKFWRLKVQEVVPDFSPTTEDSN